jgi:sugar phosphate isomerase/epimerase
MTVASELVLYAGCMAAAPFREYIAAASSAGFDAVTVWPLMYRRAISREGLDPRSMRTILDDVGVRVTDLDPCADWIPAPSRETAAGGPAMFRSVWDRRDFFEAASALGSDTLVAVDLEGDPADADRFVHEMAVEGFAGLCDDAAEHGMRVALEFMPFSRIKSLTMGWEVVEQAGRANGGLVVDTCHLARGGWDPALLASIPADRIYAIQISDVPTAAPVDLRDESVYHRLIPGEGALDLGHMLSVLESSGVCTRVGPELYRPVWSQRAPADVARDLAAATRALL